MMQFADKATALWRWPANEQFRIVAVALLAIVASSLTFVLDLHLPLGISIVTPYVGVVLLGLWLGRVWTPILLAAIATILVIVGFFYSPFGGDPTLGILNRSFAVGSFWITALLCYWYATSASEIAKERAHLKAVIETSPDAILTIDHQAVVRSLNRSAQTLFGYSDSDVIGKGIHQLISSSTGNDENGPVGALLTAADRGTFGAGREVQARHKDGRLFPAYLTIGRVDGRDSPLFVGVLHDISDRVAAERAIAAERNFIASVLDTTDALVVVTDRKGDIVSFNQACEKLTGRSAGEVLGSPLWTFAPPRNQDEVRRRLAALIRTGGSVRYESEWKTKADEERLIAWSKTVFRDDSGSITHVVATGVDVTDQRYAERESREHEERSRELQAELFHVSRLSDLGEMASAIAHELNQPLTAILNYLEATYRVLDKEHAALPPKVREYVEKASAQATRAGDIIRHLRRMIRREETARQSTDINRLVEDAVTLAGIGAGEKGIDITFDLAPDLPLLVVDGTQIHQVVFNLVRNSVEALAYVAKRQISVRTASAAGGGVEVSVSDTGPGLTKGIAERLFMPFVTTKTTGLGIGLSICRTIVESHGGQIWATPNPERGVTFRFTLPLTTESAVGQRRL
jgi:two-component system sensor kinase FixL